MIKTSSEFQSDINLQANILPLKNSYFAYSVIKNNSNAWSKNARKDKNYQN